MEKTACSKLTKACEEIENPAPLTSCFQPRIPRNQRSQNVPSSIDTKAARLSAPEGNIDINHDVNIKSDSRLTLPLTKKDISAINITRKLAEDLRNAMNIESALDIQGKVSTNDVISPFESMMKNSAAEFPLSQNYSNNTNNQHIPSNNSSLVSLQTSQVTSGTTESQSSFTKRGKPSKKSPQLLHKRLKQTKGKDIPSSDLISSLNIEDLILSSNVHQWLIYSWMSKAKDKSMTEKYTQRSIGEILILRQYAFPSALCATLSTSQHESAARLLMNVFLDLHHVFTKKQSRLGGYTVGRSRSVSVSSEEDESLQKAPIAPLIPLRVEKLASSGLSGTPKVPPIPVIKRKDHLLGFLNAMIAEEVSESKSESTLLRSNNVTSKLLTLYGSKICKDYIQKSLEPALRKVIKMGSLEVDPAKLAATAKELSEGDINHLATENMKKLLVASKIVLLAVTSSAENAPLELRKIAFLLQAQIDRKFGSSSQPSTPCMSKFSFGDNTPLDNADSEQIIEPSSPVAATTRTHQVALSGFIFLRFICPSIVSPDAFLPDITPLERRSLVLISKVLQNIANGVKFGSKESYMIGANPFLQQNEKDVVKYCENLQILSDENVFLVSEDDEERRGQDFDSSLAHLIGLFNQQMDKILLKTSNIYVKESVTFTVFAAIKPIIKRFESIEKQFVTVENVKPLQFNKNDRELAKNLVLLGGLEEILLMNGCSIIKGLLSPSNFYKGKPFSQISIDDGENSQLLTREMEIIARSTVNIVGPHGTNRLCDIVEFTIEEELLLLRGKYSSFGSSKIMSLMLESFYMNMVVETKYPSFNWSISKKLLQFFLTAILRDTLRLNIGDLFETIENCKNYEIDLNVEESEDAIKDNFESLVNISLKLFDKIAVIRTFPEALKRLVRFLSKHFNEKEETRDFERVNEGTILEIGNFLFLGCIFEMISSPARNGLCSRVTNSRIFLLISFMLKFLLKLKVDEIIEDRNVLIPLKEHLTAGMSDFVKAVIFETSFHPVSATPSPALHQNTSPHSASNSYPISIHNNLDSRDSQNSLSSSRSRSSLADYPLNLPIATRARAVLYVKKILTPYALKKLKDVIITDFKRKHDDKKELELSEIKVDTIHYRLNDRIQCVFWNLFHGKSSFSGRSKSVSVSKPHLPGMICTSATDEGRYTDESLAKNDEYQVFQSATTGSIGISNTKKEKKWLSSQPLSNYKKLVKSIFSYSKSHENSLNNLDVHKIAKAEGSDVETSDVEQEFKYSKLRRKNGKRS